VTLHDGLLSHDGWYLLDDSATALWATDGTISSRASSRGQYQSGYFFGYGDNYKRALREFAELTSA
jgi:hypothetical protein